MYINANQKELLELAKHFYNITNTLISIYDENQKLVCSYPDNMCKFCSEIRRSNELASKCIENDNTAFEICKKTKQTHIYHCHMGLIEVAAPIIYNNIIMGYMLFGQITDHKNKTELLPKIDSVVSKYDLDRDILVSSLQKIRYRTTDYIHSIAKLLEMYANYIWLNSIINIKNEGIAVSIDLYIKEHIKETLSIPELCRQFNISRSTLYEIFIKNFGCSVSTHVQNYRNEYAKKLLRESGLSVSEIAEAVGIKDTNYFIRFFKKRNGCTPKTYQKQFTTYES